MLTEREGLREPPRAAALIRTAGAKGGPDATGEHSDYEHDESGHGQPSH